MKVFAINAVRAKQVPTIAVIVKHLRHSDRRFPFGKNNSTQKDNNCNDNVIPGILDVASADPPGRPASSARGELPLAQ